MMVDLHAMTRMLFCYILAFPINIIAAEDLMKLLFDFFPIILFFASYKIFHHDIFIATAVVIVVSIIQVLIYWLKYRRVEALLLTNCVLILLFGGTTLLLHQEIYVKWKASVIYWLYAVALIASQYFGTKPLVQRALETNLTLPAQVWAKVNWICAIYFAGIGFINLFVVYHFSTNAWVDFKLFGILGLTILFFVGLSFYLSRYIDPKSDTHR